MPQLKLDKAILFLVDGFVGCDTEAGEVDGGAENDGDGHDLQTLVLVRFKTILKNLEKNCLILVELGTLYM